MKASDDTALSNTADYRQFIEDLKARVIAACLSAARAVNRDLILLYWDIGRRIVEKQRALGWGESVIDRVSRDMREAFPASAGFSPRNLRDMRRLYLAYAEEAKWRQLVANLPGRAKADDAEIRRQLVAEIPWGQDLLILNKLADPAARLYYLRATARFGWSRNVLLNQIKAGAYERAMTEKKAHNFPLALPEYLAEQADEMLKSAYNLEFLGIRREVKERELEDRLIERLRDFLLELGYGFCFVGRRRSNSRSGRSSPNSPGRWISTSTCSTTRNAPRTTTPPSASSSARKRMMSKSSTL